MDELQEIVGATQTLRAALESLVVRGLRGAGGEYRLIRLQRA